MGFLVLVIFADHHIAVTFFPPDFTVPRRSGLGLRIATGA
jgi:hypothetical protein